MRQADASAQDMAPPPNQCRVQARVRAPCTMHPHNGAPNTLAGCMHACSAAPWWRAVWHHARSHHQTSIPSSPSLLRLPAEHQQQHAAPPRQPHARTHLSHHERLLRGLRGGRDGQRERGHGHAGRDLRGGGGCACVCASKQGRGAHCLQAGRHCAWSTSVCVLPQAQAMGDGPPTRSTWLPLGDRPTRTPRTTRAPTDLAGCLLLLALAAGAHHGGAPAGERGTARGRWPAGASDRHGAARCEGHGCWGGWSVEVLYRLHSLSVRTAYTPSLILSPSTLKECVHTRTHLCVHAALQEETACLARCRWGPAPPLPPLEAGLLQPHSYTMALRQLMMASVCSGLPTLMRT